MLLQIVPKRRRETRCVWQSRKSRKARRRTGRTRRPFNFTETCLSAFPNQRYTKVPSHRNFHRVVSGYSFPEAVCSPMSSIKGGLWSVGAQHNNTNHHLLFSWWQQGCKTPWYTHWKCGVVHVTGTRPNQDYVQYVTPIWWYIFYCITAIGKNLILVIAEQRWGEASTKAECDKLLPDKHLK